MSPFVRARNLLAAQLTPRRSLAIQAYPVQPSGLTFYWEHYFFVRACPR